MSRDSYPVDPQDERGEGQSPLEQPIRLSFPRGGPLDGTSEKLLRTTSEPLIV